MASKAALKIKKKRWVAIYSDKLFGDQPLGEVFVGEAQEAMGRAITVSMMQLSHDPKKQNINVTFTINAQKEGGLGASFTGMNIVPSALKRLVRRNKEKVDDSFSVITSDNKLVRMKPIIVTRGHVTGGTLRDLRFRARNVISWEVAKSSYEKLAGDLIDHKLQRAVHEACSAIYPIAVCDIRQFKLLGEAKVKTGPGIVPPPMNPPFVPRPKKTPEPEMQEGETQADEVENTEAAETPAEEAAPTEPAAEKPKKSKKKKDDAE